MKTMIAGMIYRAVEAYDPDSSQFNCYLPVEYADGCVIGDCWVCDEKGHVHSGYANAPVPVDASQLGEPVGHIFGRI